MKKLSLLLVFSFLFLFSVSAQESGEEISSSGNNFFLGAGVKGNVFVNDAAQDIDTWKIPSLGGELFLGKWFSHKVGARIFFEGGTLHPFFQERKLMVDEKYVLGRLDFLLDLTNCFRSYSPDRFYNLIPHVGIGGVYAFDALKRPDRAENSSSFVWGGGLLNTFRLSNLLSAYINLNLDVVDANLDGHKGINTSVFESPYTFNGIASASVGLIYKFGGKSSKKEIVIPPVVQEELPISIVEPQPQPQPKPQPQPEPPRVEPQPVIPFPNNVFFRLNSAAIDENQQLSIANTVEYMKANPNAKIKVVGYADKQTGKANYNMKLSEKRAKNVAKELVGKYKVSSDRMKVEWKGDTVQPFNDNDRNRVVILAE